MRDVVIPFPYRRGPVIIDRIARRSRVAGRFLFPESLYGRSKCPLIVRRLPTGTASQPDVLPVEFGGEAQAPVIRKAQKRLRAGAAFRRWYGIAKLSRRLT
jgi:hypothetical protein